MDTKKMSIIAIVCGGVGLVLSFFPIACYFALAASIVGLIFSIKAMKSAKENNVPKGLAVAALIVSIVGLVFGVIFGCVYTCAFAAICANPDAVKIS